MAFCCAVDPEDSRLPFSQEIDDALVEAPPVLLALLELGESELPSLLSSEPHADRTSAPVIATAPTVRARRPLLR
jgi:hypothetical protein